MPNTDERRAKIIAENWALLHVASYNHEDFQRRWKAFTKEKDRINVEAITSEFMRRYEDF